MKPPGPVCKHGTAKWQAYERAYQCPAGWDCFEDADGVPLPEAKG